MRNLNCVVVPITYIKFNIHRAYKRVKRVTSNVIQIRAVIDRDIVASMSITRYRNAVGQIAILLAYHNWRRYRDMPIISQYRDINTISSWPASQLASAGTDAGMTFLVKSSMPVW